MHVSAGTLQQRQIISTCFVVDNTGLFCGLWKIKGNPHTSGAGIFKYKNKDKVWAKVWTNPAYLQQTSGFLCSLFHVEHMFANTVGRTVSVQELLQSLLPVLKYIQEQRHLCLRNKRRQFVNSQYELTSSFTWMLTLKDRAVHFVRLSVRKSYFLGQALSYTVADFNLCLSD